MATIKDVAKYADVSISTVSCALNGGTGRVSNETKERVRQAAEKLGYKPNAVARSLKTKKTNIIGVFLGCFDGPIYAEIRRAIQQVCRFNNYEAIFAECDFNSKTMERVISQKLIDGAIVLAAVVDDEVIKAHANEDFPIIVLDRELDHPHVSCITIDNETAGYKIAKHFHEQGFFDVGYIAGSEIGYDNHNRISGFNRGIKEFGLRIKKEWKLSSDFTEIGGYQVMIDFIQTKTLPRAMFIANDEMAYGALHALREHNIRVPEDIALIGFDDTDMCKVTSPSLSSVSRPSYELGLIATNILFESMSKKRRNTRIILPTELVKRESCSNN